VNLSALATRNVPVVSLAASIEPRGASAADTIPFKNVLEDLDANGTLSDENTSGQQQAAAPERSTSKNTGATSTAKTTLVAATMAQHNGTQPYSTLNSFLSQNVAELVATLGRPQQETVEAPQTVETESTQPAALAKSAPASTKVASTTGASTTVVSAAPPTSPRTTLPSIAPAESEPAQYSESATPVLAKPAASAIAAPTTEYNPVATTARYAISLQAPSAQASPAPSKFSTTGTIVATKSATSLVSPAVATKTTPSVIPAFTTAQDDTSASAPSAPFQSTVVAKSTPLPVSPDLSTKISPAVTIAPEDANVPAPSAPVQSTVVAKSAPFPAGSVPSTKAIPAVSTGQDDVNAPAPSAPVPSTEAPSSEAGATVFTKSAAFLVSPVPATKPDAAIKPAAIMPAIAQVAAPQLTKPAAKTPAPKLEAAPKAYSASSELKTPIEVRKDIAPQSAALPSAKIQTAYPAPTGLVNAPAVPPAAQAAPAPEESSKLPVETAPPANTEVSPTEVSPVAVAPALNRPVVPAQKDTVLRENESPRQSPQQMPQPTVDRRPIVDPTTTVDRATSVDRTKSVDSTIAAAPPPPSPAPSDASPQIAPSDSTSSDSTSSDPGTSSGVPSKTDASPSAAGTEDRTDAPRPATSNADNVAPQMPAPTAPVLAAAVEIETPPSEKPETLITPQRADVAATVATVPEARVTLKPENLAFTARTLTPDDAPVTQTKPLGTLTDPQVTQPLRAIAQAAPTPATTQPQQSQPTQQTQQAAQAQQPANGSESTSTHAAPSPVPDTDKTDATTPKSADLIQPAQTQQTVTHWSEVSILQPSETRSSSLSSELAEPAHASSTLAAQETHLTAPELPKTSTSTDILLHLTDNDQSSVAIRVADRAGAVNVSVHASDPVLRDSLRSNLGELSSQLSEQGWKAEALQSVATAAPSDSRQDSHGGGQQSSQQQQSFGGDRQPQRDRRSSGNQWQQELEQQISGGDARPGGKG